MTRTCVGWSFGTLVGFSATLLSKSMKNGLLRILSDLDSPSRGRKRDEVEGGTRRKEGRTGRRDEEEEGTRRKERRGGGSDEEEGATRRVKK